MKSRNWFLIILIGVAVLAGAVVSLVFLRYHRAVNPDSSQRPRLVIYSYSSFVDSLGPGPEIIEKFKAECLCDIEVVDVGSGSLLLERLKLVPDRQVDVVIGLDQLNLKSAVQSVKWRNIKLPPMEWRDEIKNSAYSMFVPFDWSPMVFLSQKVTVDHENLSSFIASVPKRSLALQSADLSSPGLQFLYWAWNESAMDLKRLEVLGGQLSSKVHSHSPEWSGSYSLFQSGAAPIVFTYWTSSVYHAEKGEQVYTQKIANGHPVQVEYAGVPEQCMSCGIAETFVRFLLKPEIQKLIMQKNYMLPVLPGIAEGTPFSQLPELKLLSPAPMDQFVDEKQKISEIWKRAVRD